jgi:hypothetical protein
MHRTFSPRKFLISSLCPLSWMMQLIGKWAYTARILYRKPYSGDESLQGTHNDVLTFVTPVIMLDMSDFTVLRQATCFRFPCQTARVTLLLLPLTKRTSMLIWRMFFVSVPRGPVTTITRDLTATVTPSGISSSSVLRMSRIYKDGVSQHVGIYFVNGASIGQQP